MKKNQIASRLQVARVELLPSTLLLGQGKKSDVRLKEEITEVEGALDRVMNVKVEK